MTKDEIITFLRKFMDTYSITRLSTFARDLENLWLKSDNIKAIQLVKAELREQLK